jgi:hypothetical protein
LKEEVDMKLDRRLAILGILLVVATMVAATQYAVTRLGYEYNIVHPSDADVRYIGSDNSSDNIRVLRVAGNNSSMVSLKLRLGGNFTTNQQTIYTAAFGIVNEENYSVNITHINVSSTNWTYLKIWLHGDRDANANSTTTDPTSVYMYNNDTLINGTNTTAWILASGDADPNTMCYNVSDRTNCSINTTWDETAHVRYSLNNSNATSELSDFVWVQVAVDIGDVADYLGLHTGTIYIHLASDVSG